MLIDAVVTRQQVIDALVMTERDLEAYLAGTAIPLLRQACLAQFVIDQVPTYLRWGFRLRSQLAATIAIESGETVVHHDARPEMWR